jgi:hypothetical protein
MTTLRDRIYEGIQATRKARYGWDGIEGLPARDDAVAMAHVVLAQPWLWPDGLPPDCARVVLLADGTLGIDLDRGPKSVHLMFPCAGVVGWVRERLNGSSVDGIIKTSSPPRRDELVEIAEVLRWLEKDSP